MNTVRDDLPRRRYRTSRSRDLVVCLFTGLAAIGLYYALPSGLNELARRTAAILFVAGVFWATEALPLFATALCVIGLQILFLASDGGLAGVFPALSPFPAGPDGAPLKLRDTAFLGSWASPVIFLFMGGLLLSSAVTKHGLDRVIGSRLMRPFSRGPTLLIFGVLGITAFFSMWMSNTATTAMMLAIITPLANTLPANDAYRRGLVLAVPFGANIGGIGTPIGTPPNAVALAVLRRAGFEIGFVDWMILAVPLAVLMLVVAGVLLRALFPPAPGTALPKIQKQDEIDGRGRLTLIVLVATMLLWLTGRWHGVSPTAVALVAAAALTALRVLDRRDVDSIDWNVLILMWGGLSLGHAMKVTGLVDAIVGLPVIDTITTMDSAWRHFVLAAVVTVLGVTLSTFMSNTATAALLVPMAMALSPSDHGALAILTALACSFAMAMPVSTPPNAMAFASGSVPVVSLIRSGGAISMIGVAVLLFGFQPMLHVFRASASRPETERKIAVVVPLSGRYSAIGTRQLRGYEMARDEIGAADARVRYVDVGDDPDAIAAVIETEIMPWKPDVIVGPYTSESALAAARYLAGKGVPLVVPTANVDPLTQRPGTTVFRIAPPQQMMAISAADFIAGIREESGITRIVILAEDTDYGRAAAGAIAGTCLMKSLPPTRAVLFEDASVKATAAELQLEEDELIVVISRSEAACRHLIETCSAKCRVLGFSGAFATANLRDFAVSRAGTVKRDIDVLSPWHATEDRIEATRFVGAYRERFADVDATGPHYHTVQAHAAMVVACRAVREARRERTAVVDVLRAIEVRTPLGPVRFIDFGGYHQQNPANAVIERWTAQ
ncbi:MAG: hypothetical protein CMJ18_09705 [Phycisphaeraceae bacterium]|nr:hypothetical protein [Phycisphaeraceae bacterium]